MAKIESIKNLSAVKESPPLLLLNILVELMMTNIIDSRIESKDITKYLYIVKSLEYDEAMERIGIKDIETSDISFDDALMSNVLSYFLIGEMKNNFRNEIVEHIPEIDYLKNNYFLETYHKYLIYEEVTERVLKEAHVCIRSCNINKRTKTDILVYVLLMIQKNISAAT